MLNDVLISIGGITLTVLLAWWLNRRDEAPRLDTEAAKALAGDALSGFVAEAAYVDADGLGALVRGRGGSTALLKRQGAHWTARLVPPGTHASCEGDDLVVALPEPMFGSVRLRLGEDPARTLALNFKER